MKSNLTKLVLLSASLCLSSNAFAQDWTGATETLYFDFDRSANTSGVDTSRIKEVLQSCDVNSLSITGHTDSSGNAQYNQQLSMKRAEVIKAEVASWGLIDGSAITTRGAGENELAIDTGDGVKEQLNRRSVIQFGFSLPCGLYYTQPAPAAPVDTVMYEAPVETVVYEAPAEVVVYQEPVVVSQPYVPPAPAAPAPVVSAPVVSAPVPATVPAVVAAPTPVPVAVSGLNWPLIALGGVAGVLLVDQILDDDDEPTSP